MSVQKTFQVITRWLIRVSSRNTIRGSICKASPRKRKMVSWILSGTRIPKRASPQEPTGQGSDA